MKTYNNAMKMCDVGLCGPAPHGSLLGLITGVGVLATFVIAGMGMSGHITPSIMGWSLTGISAGLTMTAILGAVNERKEKKKEALGKIIVPLALVILSTLTSYGMLSNTTLGWCIFGPMIGGATITALLLTLVACRKKPVPHTRVLQAYPPPKTPRVKRQLDGFVFYKIKQLVPQGKFGLAKAHGPYLTDNWSISQESHPDKQQWTLSELAADFGISEDVCEQAITFFGQQNAPRPFTMASIQPVLDQINNWQRQPD